MSKTTVDIANRIIAADEDPEGQDGPLMSDVVSLAKAYLHVVDYEPHEVQTMIAEAVTSGAQGKLSEDTESYKRVAAEALCELFVGGCYVAGGGDPDMLSSCFHENTEKAEAIIIMVVEAVSQLPEGGVRTRDLWERVMRKLDE